MPILFHPSAGAVVKAGIVAMTGGVIVASGCGCGCGCDWGCGWGFGVAEGEGRGLNTGGTSATRILKKYMIPGWMNSAEGGGGGDTFINMHTYM